MKSLILIFFFVSCATHQPQPILFESNKVVWLNRSVDEVLLHPEFATRQMTNRKASDGSELITFKNSGGIHSSGDCTTYKGFSSCTSSTGEIVCNHLFLIKKGRVVDYYRMGSCSDEDIRFRPRDTFGNPVLTDSEKDQINRRDLASEKKECAPIARLLKAQGC
jgi:hypothetical protein